MSEEDVLPVDEVIRARVRGLSRNPALPDALVPRILAHPAADTVGVVYGREWSDELFEIVAAHPDVSIRETLARSGMTTAEQRVRLIDDPARSVIVALLEGPHSRRSHPLPAWAYRKMAANPTVKRTLLLFTPRELPSATVAGFAAVDEEIAAWAARTPDRPEPTTVEQARAIATGDMPWKKARLALQADLPADVVTILAKDPDPAVRTHVSMRPGLSEQQRAAIDYRVTPNDRLPRLAWVLDADGEQLQRCVSSAHPGLRRSAAGNKRLTADQIAELAADDDFPVRLLLCENQEAVPAELVVRTFLEARVITRGELLSHPALAGADLTRYADSPHWGARALVVRDRRAPAELIERLSRDEHPGVRSAAAGDARLSQQRLLELFADPDTSMSAAANPNLPVELMVAILEAPIDAGEPAVLRLGRTMPSHEPITEV